MYPTIPARTATIVARTRTDKSTQDILLMSSEESFSL
jgi:hypothetical protein